MEAREINRRVKKLVKDINAKKDNSNVSIEMYYRYLNTVAKKEFTEIYNSDPMFVKMNSYSIRMMFRLNQQHRFEPFHLFGIKIETI